MCKKRRMKIKIKSNQALGFRNICAVSFWEWVSASVCLSVGFSVCLCQYVCVCMLVNVCGGCVHVFFPRVWVNAMNLSSLCLPVLLSLCISLRCVPFVLFVSGKCLSLETVLLARVECIELQTFYFLNICYFEIIHR